MKIRNQFFFTLLILGVAVTLLISFLIYTRGKSIILTQIYSNLEAVSQTKESQLEKIIQSRLEQLRIITQGPLLLQKLEKHSKNNTKENDTDLDSILSDYARSSDIFYRVYIANNEGVIISSSDPSLSGKDISKEESFTSVNKNGHYLDGFFFNEKRQLCLTGGLVIYHTASQKSLGQLLIDLKADDFISLTNDYTGLGATGETVIAKQYQQPVVLNPTRFDPEAALNVKIPKNDPRYGLNIAFEGKEGVFEDVLDYRSNRVITSTRFIEQSGWALTTKMDKTEAYNSINQLRNFLIMLNLGFIVFAFIASFYMGRYLARPIEELISSTNRIKEGDSNYRVKSTYNNELGTLAEAFNNMADRLERKINELDKVSYVISHDLRAPLGSIPPLVDFIKEDNKGNLNPETDRMLEMIRTKVTQMNELIKEILETAKTEKKIKENIDVDSLVSTVIGNLNPSPSIQFFIQHNLPIVQYHKISLIQVFQNLLHNSIKFMDKEKGIINVGYSEEKDFYKFWITDNGPGIPEKMRGKNFKMYEAHHNESTGIGLGVVKKIIGENGGSIWVDSTPSQGSTFYFTIPKF